MSDIDKSLPNVEQEIKLPSEEELVEASQENIEEAQGAQDVQVTQEEDGGATISFDPEAINQPGTNEHFDNLADLLPEEVLGRGLGVAASPAVLAPFAVGDIASQIAEGDTPTDIATNPFNYLYPAFAEQTPKLTRGLSPTLRKVARLGLSGPALRILSRAGIGGFAASAAIQGLGLLDD